MYITGAKLFVEVLKKEKVDTLFAYPGGQAMDLFDALYDEKNIQIVLPRHEQGLIHAADGYARSTGKVGVCLVTSGPGATNLVTGIATAHADSVPLVCFTGQVTTDLMGRDAFQEVNIVDITKSITKYAVTVKKREDLAKTIQKAFYIARSGKPGVVVVDLPKDIQKELADDELHDRNAKNNMLDIPVPTDGIENGWVLDDEHAVNDILYQVPILLDRQVEYEQMTLFFSKGIFVYEWHQFFRIYPFQKTHSGRL